MKSFAKESAAFARALQAEHRALGELLVKLDQAGPEGVDRLSVAAAREAHAAVEHQRLRTEAARGT